MILDSSVQMEREVISLQDHFRFLQRWYADWTLEINESKSELGFISKRQRLLPELQVNGRRIAYNVEDRLYTSV